MSSAWNKSLTDDADTSEITVSSLRMMTEEQQQSILFKAVRACDLHVIRSVLQVNRTLLNAKMFGYEGTDVFEVIKNSKSKRCYSYTGLEKDGFFYPLHVAAEMGHKNLTILLVKAGADIRAIDYRGRTAEENCNGNAQHAFFELRGLKFEARERYQGKTDRQGLRTGQGIMFYKPEGYMQEEKQLYRGSFKNGLYHGHGTLYFPGMDVIAYIGRFKEGMKHGRGIEFDVSGHKVYQGTFRDDKREGRGEEFADGQRTYKGEYMNNMRHGFGVAYYSENSKYYGRYEHNLMSGVGIYVHPDGNRFEGMFFNNKADGSGSFYERDPFTGNFSGTHAVWQAGKKLKEANTPFVPTLADLPDDTTKNLFNEIMNNHHAVISGYADEEDEQQQHRSLLYNGSSNDEQDGEKGGHEQEAGDQEGMKKRKKEKLDFTYFDQEAHMQAQNKTDWWKVQLGKYMKLPLQEAPLIGLNVPAAVLNQAKPKTEDDEDNDKEGGGDGNDDDSDDEVDEVIGYHFMDCTTLFASYVYVTSASKVFEDRLVNKGLTAEFPDFEAVYHLVIDAVDNYNDTWEMSYRLQQTQQQQAALATSANTATTTGSSSSSHNNANTAHSHTPTGHNPHSQHQHHPGTSTNLLAMSNANVAGGMDLESRRLMFMTEKEKKAEQILKQRAELAVKKGTAELDSKIEKSIAVEVLATLEQELTKLLRDESQHEQEKLHMNLPIARKGMMDTHHGHLHPSNSSNSHNNNHSTPGKGNNAGNNAAASNNSAVNSSSKKKDSILKLASSNGGGTSDNNNGGDSSMVNIDDLFDLDNFSVTMTSTGNNDDDHNNNNSSSNNHNNDGDDQTGSNEFAAELLYIMRMSMALT